MCSYREDLLMESELPGSLATVESESVDWEYTLLSFEPRKEYTIEVGNLPHTYNP